jgi:ubiquinone/menaquinone biosynthesis C-methylase UbiE
MSNSKTTKTRKNLRAALLRKLFDYFGLYRFQRLRKWYWEFMVEEIDQRYGGLEGDHETLKSVFAIVSPQRLLDIGCGSGRLFPLYQQSGIQELVGQDIAQPAIDLAQSRYIAPKIQFFCQPIEELNFPKSFFDLIICNRVLQHIPPESFDAVIRKLADLGQYIYINETSEQDFDPRIRSWLYKHDYVGLFQQYGFQVRQEGTMSSGNERYQKWILLMCSQ